MKKLIFILFLFIGQFCFSQVDFNKKDSLSMDNEIVPYVEEFIEDARARGFYVRSFLIQRIDYMYFDNSIGTMIYSDIVISVERIADNAKDFNVTFEEELKRVIIHGVLHLCGYKDKSKEEDALMRQKENEKIMMFHMEH